MVIIRRLLRVQISIRWISTYLSVTLQLLQKALLILRSAIHPNGTIVRAVGILRRQVPLMLTKESTRRWKPLLAVGLAELFPFLLLPDAKSDEIGLQLLNLQPLAYDLVLQVDCLLDTFDVAWLRWFGIRFLGFLCCRIVQLGYALYRHRTNKAFYPAGSSALLLWSFTGF